MATEKKMTVDETTGEVVEPAAKVIPVRTELTQAELDFAFNVASTEENENGEPVVPQSEWKFPGLRVTRSTFTYKGKQMYSYAVNMMLKLSSGAVHKLTCELRSSDRKNASNYEKLDTIWGMLPKDKQYMLLGFQFVEYTNSYNLCVQIEDNGIPLRVSLTPRDGKSRDDLSSMIAFLQQNNKL